ncbi:homocysteine S-methyltransferase family protein [Christensenellaceae bacterium OttesenSCG-928-M15]|nr:homocysteine S-methyltransferase family protein [Christensenellaceae bacterium OttesenSCG-928-M15]
MKFLDAIQSEILLFDGAMSTELMERQLLRAGECAELLNTTRPMDVMDIHQGYLDAGANVITTNTYNANTMKLSQFGLEKRTEELVQSGVALAREAAMAQKGPAFVAASVGSTGEIYHSDPRMPQRMYNTFYEQCTYSAAAGADLIVIETMSDIREARLALLAARASTHLPVLACFTLEPDDNTYAGNPPEVLSLVSYKLGASLVGVNCGLMPKELFEGYSRLAGSAAIPTYAAPNAGHNTTERLSPEEMAEDMLPYLHSGAALIGGCCYTTAAHIRAMRKLLESHHGHARAPKPIGPFICSAQKRLNFMDFEEHTPINLKKMTIDEAVEAIIEAAKERSELQIDFADWSGESIRMLLFRLSPSLLKTPLCFHVHAARQANAALFAYPGIAAVCAESDAYNVMKAAARYGAEVVN